MKKRICSAFLLLLSLSLQGCAGQQKETETQPETHTELETQSEVETETEAETETQEEAAEKTKHMRVNTIIGSLADIDMEQITVLSDNGNEIILPIDGTELDFCSGFRVGNLVSVNYTGELLETDGRKADISVLRAADSSDVEEVKISASGEKTGEMDSEESAAPEETESTEETESETEGEVQTVRGKMQSMDRNSMTILTEDQKELTFGIMNVKMYFSKGMAKGTEIEVSYRGEITGDDQEVVSVTDADSR
jgi:hypothetical protein